MEENEGNMMQQEDNKSMQSSDKKKEMAKKVAEKATKKLATKGSLMAPLAHIIMIAAPILIAIIILGGIIVFFLTMPGMVMDQLKALFQRIGNSVAAFFGADTTKMIDDKEVYETLDYLEQMGYDLKGFGFLTEYITDLGQADYDSSSEDPHLDSDMGVVRDAEEKIISAKSDFIFTYMVSDNYVYTLKNDNIATLNSDPDSWIDGIANFFKARWTGCYKVLNFIAGPILDKVGVTEAVMDTWGSGLIALYYDTGVVGEKEKPVNDSTLWNWDSVSIDASSKKLSIKRHTFLNNNNAMEFSLDGWTGRYGMPLEFLLSIHVATMMPDLAYDMATSFATNVNIYLHETDSGTAITAYKSGEKYITYGDLETAFSGTNGEGWFNATIAWFDGWTITDEEAEKAYELGMPRSPNCEGDCGVNESVSFAGFPCTLVEGSDPPEYTCSIPDETAGTTEITVTESQVSKHKSYCSTCKKYLKRILKLLRKDNDYDFLTYIPYIASVTNHWYRDVYFVEDDDVKGEFIDYDYDYEAITGERWTLYETYGQDEKRAGQFKLYKVNENGDTTNELFDGTREEAAEQGIAVAKKAKTIESNEETFEDYSWEKNSEGRWTAYTVDDEVSEGNYERLFEDEEIEADDDDADIKKNLYVKISTSGTAVQKGEGLRTETNSQIKKMFLQNQYYKYDGTAETAEVITALREEGKYGALDENALSKKINVTTTSDDGETITTERKASEVSGKVSLNQDSLNAFSMLENTHTLDADFIYRDFKELIVELGYFEKEELTDETPRLLQWIIPEIESGGYPNRSIDKNENEFGTMIHSEGDIKANEKNTVLAIYQKHLEENEDPNINNGAIIDDNIHGIYSQVDKSNLSEATKDINSFAAVDTNIDIRNSVKGATTDFERISESGDGYEFKVRAGSVEYTHYYQFQGSYSEKYFTWAGKQCTLHDAACGPTSCVNLLTGYGQDVNPTNDIVGINFAATIYAIKDFMESYGVTGESYVGLSDAEYKEKIEEAFSEGRPIITLMHASKTGDTFWTSEGHFVPMLGMDSSGNIITLDPGTSNPDRHTYTGGIDGLMSTLVDLWIADEPPDGMSKSGGTYTGYKGNEAVVSPVTGILLDYGTYDGVEDKSSITDELYRQNVDLKYQKSTDASEEGAEGGEGENDGAVVNPEYDPSKPDLVGYAKILVLDSENYKKLEAKSGTKWASNSLVSTETVINDSGDKIVKAHYDDDDAVNEEEKIEDLSEIEKTVYGYKEFAESYESGGIAGYVVYIDGFECYKPDEEFTEEQLETEAPSKDSDLQITLDSFKKVTVSNIESAAEDDELKMDSLYEKDETHKMASKKATEKLKAVAAVKEEAISTMYVDDLIFIKEGTVLGRTITDFQLIEEYRGESYSTYRTPKGEDEGETPEADTPPSEDEEENTDAVIGNYIRILFRDLDDSVVEDVETYMKIDEGEVSQAGDQEYQFQEGDLDLLADAIHHEGCGSYDDPSGSREDQLYLSISVGYTMINKLNSDSGYNHAAGWGWAPDKSQLYNLLCVVPCAAHGGKGWYAISDAGTLGGLKNRADQNQYEYCDMCMEAAEYIKENDSMNFKNNGKYETQYSSGEGMPHTCWEQGANYTAGRIWAHFRNDYLFDPSDK